jgi:glycosyltransferase involved in cell wall biosynthesis
MTTDLLPTESSRTPIVGVIIPCYKVSRFIRRTVTSIIAQEWPHWEALVVDDGSPDAPRDAIVDLLESEPRLHYIWKPNGGLSSARNFGFRNISKEAEYLIFLDGDDMLEPPALKRLVGELERYPRTGMVHCDPEFIDDNDSIIPDFRWSPRWAFGPRLLPPTEPLTPFESLYTLAGVISSLTLIRRAIYEQVPEWDEPFGSHCEDTDFFLQIALRSEIRYLPEKLVCHRRHSGQMTATSSRFGMQEEKLYAKWRAMPGLMPEQRKLVAKAEWFRTGPLAARQGYDEARRYLHNGEILMALRFFLGALHRKVSSIFVRPSDS